MSKQLIKITVARQAIQDNRWLEYIDELYVTGKYGDDIRVTSNPMKAHVYNNPRSVKAIQQLAERNGHEVNIITLKEN